MFEVNLLQYCYLMNNCNPTLKHNQKGIKLINRLDKLKHLTKIGK